MTKRELIQKLLQVDIDSEVKVVKQVITVESKECTTVENIVSPIIGIEEWGYQMLLRIEGEKR